MSDTLTTLREKVEQWLDKAEDLSGGEQTERRLCALELKALLSSLPPSPEPLLTRAQMATLRELADDLESIVAVVSTRDGDATARQHMRAEAVRAAVRALQQPPSPEPGTCGAIGYPEAGRQVCVKSAGHKGGRDDYHRSVSGVEWLGYHHAPKEPQP